ncbi:hypothetical protein FJZ21_01910 [Candidatus Pacearchaeota archaeon]|nr:hypothetical protein [Candidatus Pacearchaeota archaeon]
MSYKYLVTGDTLIKVEEYKKAYNIISNNKNVRLSSTSERESSAFDSLLKRFEEYAKDNLEKSEHLENYSFGICNIKIDSLKDGRFRASGLVIAIEKNPTEVQR